MKTYMLLMLISVFVCVSYYPLRQGAKVRNSVRRD